MENMDNAKLFGMTIIMGSAPCTLMTLYFLYVMSARHSGDPVRGDALGLMMISIVSYAIAFAFFLGGIIYLIRLRAFRKGKIYSWHLVGIGYSLIQIAIPLFYFFG